ncbi:MAG: hypothetical protein CMK59_14505 [Proteobacteria bacterium]|nr:hypothetical protein [Pseudomonadota bacterium]
MTRGGVRRFFSDQIPCVGERVFLSLEVSHHLLRVVGIAPQEEIELFNGRGACCRAKLLEVHEGKALVEAISEIIREEKDREIHLFLGLLRPQPFSTALRMATELGVTDIHPVLCERSVARGEKLQRWKKIVESSVAQSGRSEFPKVYSLCELPSAVQLVRDCQRWILHPGSQASMRRDSNGSVAVMIGPEGGLTFKELRCALDNGWSSVSFSGGVLRADTAVAAALSHFLT